MTQTPPRAASPKPPEDTARPSNGARTFIHAFCEDQGTAALIAAAEQDRRLAKTHINTQMGGVHTACTLYAQAPTPSLVIVESLLDGPSMLADLERLSQVCDTETKVIVIGHLNDVVLYRELLRRGISDYLVAPLTVEQLIESASSVLAGQIAAPAGRVVAFIGAKGGCGSSTVCHNTFWTLAETMDSEAIIADFDLPFGTLGLDFNQDSPRGMGDCLAASDRLDAAMIAKIVSKCSNRLGLLTAPCALEDAVEVDALGAAHLAQLLAQSTPFVALDMPRMWGTWARQLITHADEIVITAEPDLTSLRNTKNIVDAVGAIRGTGWVPILVLNKAGMPRRPEIALRDFANAVEVKPAVIIDFDAQLFGAAANNGQMIGEVSPRGKAAEAFRELAGALAGTAVPAKQREWLFSPLINRLSRIRAG